MKLSVSLESALESLAREKDIEYQEQISTLRASHNDDLERCREDCDAMEDAMDSQIKALAAEIEKKEAELVAANLNAKAQEDRCVVAESAIAEAEKGRSVWESPYSKNK